MLDIVNLLFVAAQVHGQHAFIMQWAQAFARKGYTVDLLVQESQPDLARAALGGGDADALRVHSLGKEIAVGKGRQSARFCQLIRRLDYERVFIYGVPEWGLLGSWYWVARRIPMYLWYTHYTMHRSLRVTSWYAKRLFCATPQSLPQYDASPKKIVTGHGIDISYWALRPNSAEGHRLLCVHRLSRSKRVELVFRALALMPSDFTLDVYGDELDAGYVAYLRRLAAELGLSDRVEFRGSALTRTLPSIYSQHRFLLNMASETIDKSMLEAMTCGCYPVVTPRNGDAIGLPYAPLEEPEAIAEFILGYADNTPISARSMFEIVAERHNLENVIEKIDSYMRPGF